MEKDAFYFPHFSNARNDRKLRRVRKELGMEGYGIYFAILEVLRDQKDFKYPLEDIDLLAEDFGTSEQKVRAVVTLYKLFENDDEDFFSIKFNEFLTPYLDAKERKKIAAMKGNLIRHKHLTKEEATEMTDLQIIEMTELVRNARNARALPSLSPPCASQKKGKESKTKQSKTNEIKENIYIDVFNHWLSFPNNIQHKKLDTQSKKSIDKILKDHNDEDIKKSITTYSTVVADKNCFFNHKWTLQEFLKRDNAFPVFLAKEHSDYTSNVVDEPQQTNGFQHVSPGVVRRSS